MYKHLTIPLVALALAMATAVSAQTLVDATGRVVRVDPGAQVIVLDNNQAFRVTPNTLVLVNNQPIPLATVQPGQVVVIRSGEAVTLAPSSAPAPGGTVVVTPPVITPPAVSTQSAPAALPRQTVFGRVTDVNTGEIKIKTDADSFEVKVPREVAAQVRKGDTVRLDLTFQPSR